MQIQENVSLANYSSMRLGGDAKYLVVASSEDELIKALSYAKESNLKELVIGRGCNTIFGDEGFNGLVIVNKITGILQTKFEDSVIMEVCSGENWDDIVKLSTELGFFDIATLSMIPGTVGAAPIQNIGAYGQQISSCLLSLRAYDKHDKKFVEINNEECNFAYRSSRFNTHDKGRFVITSVKLELSRKVARTPFYTDIEKQLSLDRAALDSVSPNQLRDAVISVRQHKLPDPSKVANCGSFFKNPIISSEQFEKISQLRPEILETPEGWTQPPYWDVGDDMKKVAAGWLIESVGLRGFHDAKTGMATWKNQALVLINETANSTYDLLQFKSKIVDAVNSKFEITLEQEPELVE